MVRVPGAEDSLPAVLATLLLAVLVGLPTVSAQSASTNKRVACVAGIADGYPCDAIDLLDFVPVAELGPGAEEVMDIWGWTDPETGAEYAIIGMNDRTSFVDISFPENARVVGWLPHSGAAPSPWRDVKVYANHAYVVADFAGLHGLQVFDLTQLREVTGDPMEFAMTAHYTGFGSAHNVAINEETGFAYAVGASGGDDCAGGLHMINIQIPDTPRFVGCFAHDGTGRAGTGYTHDVQCVQYDGPDQDYQGQEICFGSNETAVSISDVTVKGRPVALSKAEYPGVAYAHQGWLTKDKRFFMLGDELDERGGEPARSIIFDVSDLDDPVYVTDYLATTRSIDHNLYIVGDFAYQANYTAGLRILDMSTPEVPREIAFFDTTPTRRGTGFSGAWSVYPYFESGSIVVSSIGEGLFVLKATHPSLIVDTDAVVELPAQFRVRSAYPNPFAEQSVLSLEMDVPGMLRVAVADMLGREVTVAFDAWSAAGQVDIPVHGSALAAGTYVVHITLNGDTESRLITRQ
ncbi:MAG: choice-of-anchor B family protein [Rhodothermales bacterium]|nr:choice-of-anchor B family protein [Rhodothermales bacterium]